MGVCDDVIEKTKKLKTPSVKNRGLQIILGLVNLFFFGVGTILAGMIDDCEAEDIIIGILQLILPFVGWIWSIIWGVLMILDK